MPTDTLDIDKLRGIDLSRELALAMGLDLTAGDGEVGLKAALFGQTSVYNCGDRLSVHVIDPANEEISKVRWGKGSKILHDPETTSPGLWRYEWLWSQRIGQPWQESIEHWREVYRAPCPPFADDTDTALTLWEPCVDVARLGEGWEVRTATGIHIVARDADHDGMEAAFRAALCNAKLAVLAERSEA